ncbi:MAG: hypothetical protein AAFO77_06175 [Pseudomonadota bacterium]
MKKVVTAVAAAIVFAAPAAAETGRFVLETTDTGYVRMDTQSGDMAFCVEDDNQIICRAAADERAAFQQQLDALEDRVDALEAAMGSGITVMPQNGEGGLPSEEEFERGLDYMERFLNRFRGIVEGFETNAN